MLITTQVAIVSPIVTAAVVCLWIVYPLSHTIQVVALLVLIPMLLVHDVHGSYMSRGYWILRITDTPDGRSSCTKNIKADSVYNPNGYSDEFDPKRAVTYCHYEGIKWADATAAKFTGTDIELAFVDDRITACTVCDTATKHKEDYEMNLGRGLTHGYHLDAKVADTALCPGVSRRRNSAGAVGVGDQICGTCTAWFARYGYINGTGGCRDYSSNDAFCSWCPLTQGAFPQRVLTCWALFWVAAVTVTPFCNFISSQTLRNNGSRRGQTSQTQPTGTGGNDKRED